MFNPTFDQHKHRQKVICWACGVENILTPAEEMNWSIFSVACRKCGSYGLESRYDLKEGTKCPRCKKSILYLGKRYGGTQEMRTQVTEHGLDIYRFVEGGEVVPVARGKEIKPEETS